MTLYQDKLNQQEKLSLLKETIIEWLIIFELDTDTRFYSIKDWKKRKEKYLNDSLMVLVFEGGLHTILNYGGDTLEFDDLIESFGFYYELGNSWNMGFYSIDGYDYRKLECIYKEKLNDNRWEKKSALVKKIADNKCQDCGSTSNLDAHHCYYSIGHEPWEYPLSAYRCLCRNCHFQRAKTEIRIKNFLSKFSNDDLDKLRLSLDRSLYMFEKDAIFTFLSHINHNRNDFIDHANSLFMRKNNE